MGCSICGFFFVNLGGLGGVIRGFIVEGLQELEFRFNKNVMEMYDFIGLDFCGVGISMLVKCNLKIFNWCVQIFINSIKMYEVVK